MNKNYDFHGKGATYRKTNDRSSNSSTYHKKDSFYKSLRAKMKAETKKYFK